MVWFRRGRAGGQYCGAIFQRGVASCHEVPISFMSLCAGCELEITTLVGRINEGFRKQHPDQPYCFRTAETAFDHRRQPAT